MAYDITLEGKNRVVAERMLRDIASILNRCSVQYWLEGGTLLGLRRENRLLPWDNDIDLSVMIDQAPGFDSLFKALEAAGYRVRIRRFEKTTPPFKAGDIRLIKVREKRLFGLGKSAVCLEIFVKYPQDDNSYWEIADMTKQVPSRFYQSFKTIRFNDFDFSIPELTDEYLSFRYGDWQTPVKDWDTTRDDKALGS